MGKIIQITGESPSGKTSFALGYPGIKDPNEFAIFNFDVKQYPEFKYGFYGSYLHLLQDTSDAKIAPELLLVERVLKDLVNAKGKRVVIFDAWEIFAKCLTPYVLANAAKYKQVVGGGQFARMSVLGHVSKIESAILDKVITEYGVEVIFIINHLVPEYESPDGGEKGVKTGRVVPEASKRLLQKAWARFWLKANPDHPCPIAVVVKDPGIHEFTSKGIVPYRLFPDRLSPFALGERADIASMDISLWDIMAHYEKNPVKTRALLPYEQATPEEFAYVAGTLTESQAQVWEQNQRLVAVFNGQLDEELLDKINTMEGDPMSIYMTLKRDYPNLTLAQVKATIAL